MKNTIHQTLAKNIIAIRKQLGLSQEDFAVKIGIHRTYIGKIERAESNITLNTLASIAESLNMKPSHLLVDVEQKD